MNSHGTKQKLAPLALALLILFAGMACSSHSTAMKAYYVHKAPMVFEPSVAPLIWTDKDRMGSDYPELQYSLFIGELAFSKQMSSFNAHTDTIKTAYSIGKEKGADVVTVSRHFMYMESEQMKIGDQTHTFEYGRWSYYVGFYRNDSAYGFQPFWTRNYYRETFSEIPIHSDFQNWTGTWSNDNYTIVLMPHTLANITFMQGYIKDISPAKIKEIKTMMKKRTREYRSAWAIGDLKLNFFPEKDGVNGGFWLADDKRLQPTGKIWLDAFGFMRFADLPVSLRKISKDTIMPPAPSSIDSAKNTTFQSNW